MLDDLEMIKIQVEARYRHDEAGRLRNVDSRCRFFLGRTRAGNISRYREDLANGVVEQLEALVIQEPTVPDLQVPPVNLERFRDVLHNHGPVPDERMGLAYRFPDELGSVVPLVEITSKNVSLLEEIMPDFDVDLPCIAVVQEGRAVSVCQSVWISPRFHEAGVDTLEAYRRRGYAAATVAGWSTIVRGLGCIPHYSTTRDNVASQGVARKLGLALYASDLCLT